MRGQKRFTYDRTEINEISIDADMGVIALDGSILFFSDNETYGDGFDGAIAIDINPIDVGLEMRLIVGRMPEYRYFMIDVLAKFPAIPLGPSGLALYGLGGGFWANMQRQYPEDAVLTINDVPEQPDLGGEIGQTGSGAVYVPEYQNFGFHGPGNSRIESRENSHERRPVFCHGYRAKLQHQQYGDGRHGLRHAGHGKPGWRCADHWGRPPHHELPGKGVHLCG
jgi:hypothetical protein